MENQRRDANLLMSALVWENREIEMRRHRRRRRWWQKKNFEKHQLQNIKIETSNGVHEIWIIILHLFWCETEGHEQWNCARHNVIKWIANETKFSIHMNVGFHGGLWDCPIRWTNYANWQEEWNEWRKTTVETINLFTSEIISASAGKKRQVEGKERRFAVEKSAIFVDFALSTTCSWSRTVNAEHNAHDFIIPFKISNLENVWRSSELDRRWSNGIHRNARDVFIVYENDEKATTKNSNKFCIRHVCLLFEMKYNNNNNP